ncbi:MAG: ATP-binding protein [Chloroflexota bacterium]|nr:ATP-binding protein [Dehalococcoidia bacterium]MDW8254555.1 ATP-binding protein [Chloroflexota bacterium]
MSTSLTTEVTPRPVPEAAVARIDEEITALGGELQPAAHRQGSVGVTLFDTPASDDGTVTVIVPAGQLDRVANRTFVRIRTEATDNAAARSFLGVVISGPFHEPDGLRGDSPIITTTAARGSSMFLPHYHGRAAVEILGEEVEDGSLQLQPPRFRPRPNSPVFLLSEEEVKRFLKVEGDILLGRAVGYNNLEVRIPSSDKSVLPRHLAVLGSTGSGKSTTVSRLIAEARARGMAIIVLDVEGEYTFIHEPTDDATMLRFLRERGQEARGIPKEAIRLYHLVGHGSSNPAHPCRQPFTLMFDQLAPATIAEILELSEAQIERFYRAYELAVDLTIHVFLNGERERRLQWDDQERGFPGLRLSALYDVVRAFADWLDGKKEPSSLWDPNPLWSSHFPEAIKAAINEQPPKNVASWRALQGRLGVIRRLRMFDNEKGTRLTKVKLVEPGTVSIFDLSEMESPYQRNLAIAEVLRLVQVEQEKAFDRSVRNGNPPPRTLVIVEEAHEFISAERVKQMPILFNQIARIARRGRKRRLGLCFVSQSPQHLPREILGLVNNVILHRLTDATVLRDLRQAFGTVDDGLWRQLGSLAPGQAVVSFTSISQPLLVAMDPTPVKLRLID